MMQGASRASRFIHGLAAALTAAFALVLLGSPAQGQCIQTVFSEDFETGAPGWTLSGNWVFGPKDPPCGPLCGQGLRVFLYTPAFPQGCSCYAVANVPQWAPCNGELESPPIALPAVTSGTSLILDFCLKNYIDGGCSLGIDDCNRIEIRSATKLRIYSFHDDSPIFSTCPGPKTVPPYDLTEFQGEIVHLVWIPACVDGEGSSNIFVDDVKITALTSPPTSYCLTSPNSVGNGAVIGFTGLTSVAQNDLFLTVGGAPPNQFGIFYFGDGQVQLPFGLGFRCVGGSIIRLVPALPIGSGGTASLKLDFDSAPVAGKLIPGSTWFFQFWYRDPAAGGAGFNLSDGLQATFCQ